MYNGGGFLLRYTTYFLQSTSVAKKMNYRTPENGYTFPEDMWICSRDCSVQLLGMQMYLWLFRTSKWARRKSSIFSPHCSQEQFSTQHFPKALPRRYVNIYFELNKSQKLLHLGENGLLHVINMCIFCSVLSDAVLENEKLTTENNGILT